ncbi:uncharacterized protein BXZ73DRAFT_8480, partial [Epithele typhae]|uniref:uncharacterized protein n=1 Tax=Epithele typhae TaxID=378194 RepID=UPI0020074EF8
GLLTPPDSPMKMSGRLPADLHPMLSSRSTFDVRCGAHLSLSIASQRAVNHHVTLLVLSLGPVSVQVAPSKGGFITLSDVYEALGAALRDS